MELSFDIDGPITKQTVFKTRVALVSHVVKVILCTPVHFILEKPITNIIMTKLLLISYQVNNTSSQPAVIISGRIANIHFVTIYNYK